MTTNGEEVLRWYYKARSIRNAFDEFESQAPPGSMSFTTFWRHSKAYIASGRLRKTKDGYVLRYPITEVDKLFHQLTNLFFQEGETHFDCDPFYWFVEHMIESREPAIFTKRFLERCELVRMGEIVEFYNQMIESPNDALGRVMAQMELRDPDGSKRREWIRILNEERAKRTGG